jgi:hypothetical protein
LGPTRNSSLIKHRTLADVRQQKPVPAEQFHLHVMVAYMPS